MKKNSVLYRLLPFTLTVLIVAVDQLTKAWVIRNIPLNTIYKSFGDDFLWIVHVRNTGAAFSLGAGSSTLFRILILVILPLAAMIAASLFVAFDKKDTLTRAQQWFVCGIVGGGIGTLVDRIFRFHDGVVDFISVRFYGLFGLDRWPTFNISDSCVVVFVILFAISVLFMKEDRK